MTDKALWAFSGTSGNYSNTISLCEATTEDAPFIATVYNQAILAGTVLVIPNSHFRMRENGFLSTLPMVIRCIYVLRMGYLWAMAI